MKTEQELNAAMAAAKTAYLAAVDTNPAAAQKHSQELGALRAELARTLATGAKRREGSTVDPLGILKRPSYVDKNGEHAPVYEIFDDQKQARGWSPEIAVKRWNAGQFVEREAPAGAA